MIQIRAFQHIIGGIFRFGETIVQNLAALARHIDLECRLVLPVFRLCFSTKQGLDTQSGQLAKQRACLWRINAQEATGVWYKPRQ